MNNDNARAALAALGNGTRLQMVGILADAGQDGALPSELATAVGVPRNLLGAHLLVLEKAGLVTAEKRGRNRVCRIDAAAFRALAGIVGDYADVAEGTGARTK